MSFIHDIYDKRDRPVGRTTFGKLAIALVVFAGVLSLFVHLAREVIEGETLHRDSGILLFINHFASPTLSHLVLQLTQLGSPAVVLVLSVILMAYLAKRKKWQAVTQVAFAIAGAAIVDYILKLVFERARPHLWTWIVQESSYSFPSGHATMTAALAFTCMFLAWHTKWRWWVVAAGAMYMIAIGFTRLYLGVHYPTDILAGWIISFAWVLAVATILGAVRLPFWYTKR